MNDGLEAARFEAAFAGLSEVETILVAVSGGPDSIALMHLLARWAASRGIVIAAATVDHGLRDGSRREAEGVAAAATALGLSHRILAWTGRRRPGPASQDASRRARYRLLVDHARSIGATHLATAHTQDDQAETVLMRMAAGSGIAGLAGMRAAVPRSGIWHVRPLLGFAKAELVATCRSNGWHFVEDPSNADRRYARARWREMLPTLGDEGLDGARLTRLAGRAARVDDALTALAKVAFGRVLVARPGAVALQAARLRAEPEEIALRILSLAIDRSGQRREDGREAPTVRLERLEACLAALLDAHGSGRRLRRTLAGQLVSLGSDGIVAVTPEPARRRGRVTSIAAATPHSLGMDDAHA